MNSEYLDVLFCLVMIVKRLKKFTIQLLESNEMEK